MRTVLVDLNPGIQDLAKLAVLNATVRRAVVGVIEQVEHLRPELKLCVFEPWRVLRNVKVDVLEARTNQLIPLLVAVCEQLWYCKGCFVDPGRWCLMEPCTTIGVHACPLCSLAWTTSVRDISPSAPNPSNNDAHQHCRHD